MVLTIPPALIIIYIGEVNGLDIVESKRILIAGEIAKCYELEMGIAELNTLMSDGQIELTEYEWRKKLLLREYDVQTLRLYKKLHTIEGK